MRKSSVPPSPIKIAIRKALAEIGPMDCGEISLLLGSSRAVIANYVRQMRAAGEDIKICGWEYPEGAGRAAPIYLVGTLNDVPKPPRQSAAEQKRKRYAKQRTIIRMQKSGKKSALFRLNNILGL